MDVFVVVVVAVVLSTCRPMLATNLYTPALDTVMRCWMQMARVVVVRVGVVAIMYAEVLPEVATVPERLVQEG